MEDLIYIMHGTIDPLPPMDKEASMFIDLEIPFFFTDIIDIISIDVYQIPLSYNSFSISHPCVVAMAFP